MKLKRKLFSFLFFPSIEQYFEHIVQNNDNLQCVKAEISNRSSQNLQVSFPIKPDVINYLSHFAIIAKPLICNHQCLNCASCLGRGDLNKVMER